MEKDPVATINISCKTKFPQETEENKRFVKK